MTRQVVNFEKVFSWAKFLTFEQGRIHCEIFLSEYFMKYLFHVNFTLYLNIKFQLNCLFSAFMKYFSEKKAKILFSEIFLQKKLPHVHQFYCFSCVIEKRLFVKMKSMYCSELYKSIYDIHRSSRSQKFFETDAFKNFSYFIGKNLCRSLFFITLHA